MDRQLCHEFDGFSGTDSLQQPHQSHSGHIEGTDLAIRFCMFLLIDAYTSTRLNSRLQSSIRWINVLSLLITLLDCGVLDLLSFF